MKAWQAAALALVAGGCASVEELVSSGEVVHTMARASAPEVPIARFSRKLAGDPLPDRWEPFRIREHKPLTEYRLVRDGATVVLEAESDRAASGLYRRLRLDPARHPVLEWRWRVPALIPGADNRHASTEDSPARLIVSFHGDAKKLGFFERTQLRLAKAISGQALPYAMLMYVWSNHLPVGTVVENPHTERVRMIVVESGPAGLGEWRDYRRNVREDFRRAFGEDPWDVVAVGVMTDSDNTRQKASCRYGDITFRQGS